MTHRFSALDKLTLVVFAAQAAFAVHIGLNGPLEPIPLQIGLDGAVSRWGDRGELALAFAGLAALGLAISGGLGLAVARAEAAGDDARRRGLKAAQAVTLIALVGAGLLIAVVCLGEVGDRAGGPGMLMGSMGLLIAAIGAFIGRVGPNPLVGVRTPWAYKSRNAWDRSNRLAGRMWLFGGIAGVALAPIAPQPAGVQVVMAGLILSAVLAVVESWRVWRADPDRQPF